jgi:hypothetical protein
MLLPPPPLVRRRTRTRIRTRTPEVPPLLARRTRERRVLVHHNPGEQVPTGARVVDARDARAYARVASASVDPFDARKIRTTDRLVVVPCAISLADPQMQIDGQPPPPPLDGTVSLDELNVGFTEPQILAKLQKISLGPQLDDPEAHEAFERFVSGCGVSDTLLERCDITVATRPGRPALVTLVCPTAEATDAVMPEADGLARTTSVVCGRGRYIISLAFANTDDADALLMLATAPQMGGGAAPTTPAFVQQYSLVIIQEAKGVMPTEGPSEVDALERCRLTLEASMRAAHELPNLRIYEPPTWARPRQASGRAAPKAISSLQYIIHASRRLTPLPAVVATVVLWRHHPICASICGHCMGPNRHRVACIRVSVRSVLWRWR